jgi:hypothetical protein
VDRKRPTVVENSTSSKLAFSTEGLGRSSDVHGQRFVAQHLPQINGPGLNDVLRLHPSFLSVFSRSVLRHPLKVMPIKPAVILAVNAKRSDVTVPRKKYLSPAHICAATNGPKRAINPAM